VDFPTIPYDFALRLLVVCMYVSGSVSLDELQFNELTTVHFDVCSDRLFGVLHVPAGPNGLICPSRVLLLSSVDTGHTDSTFLIGLVRADAKLNGADDLRTNHN
jgi:hypothetical protein